MQLKVRDLNRFGVSGLMSESGSVFYSSDFKSKSLGRVSDLIASKVKDLHADELRLRALLLYGLYESTVLLGETTETRFSTLPVSLEVGLESDYLIIGISFNFSDAARPNFEGIEGRVQSGSPGDDFEKILGLIYQHSDHLIVRYSDDHRQIEVVSTIALGEVSEKDVAPIQVVRIEGEHAEALPGVEEYKEIGDLPFIELNKEDEVRISGAPLHTDDSTTVSGWKEEDETEQKISGLPEEAEGSQTVTGLPDEAETLAKISGNQDEDVDGFTVLASKDAEDEIEQELRKVNALPTEKELFHKLQSNGFTESEFLKLKSGSQIPPETMLRLQQANVLPEEIQRIRSLNQQSQFVKQLESSGFTPIEIQKIASSHFKEDPDLISRLTGLGYQPPEVESLFSDSFELAEKIYELRSGNAPTPIEAYRRVAAPVFTREELLAKIRAQFPELNDVEALKASNEEFQRLAAEARSQLQAQLLASGHAPKSNSDMADWLSSFKDEKRPDFKSIPFNPNQLHAVQSAFGTSSVDTQSLSTDDYKKFMDAIRNPTSYAPPRVGRSSDDSVVFGRDSQTPQSKKIQNQNPIQERKSVGQAPSTILEQSERVSPKSAGLVQSASAVDAQSAHLGVSSKKDQLEAELLKKRIRDLENQLRVEKSTKQKLQGSSSSSTSLRSDARADVEDSDSTPAVNDPIEKIELKGESRRVVARASNEPEKKQKETLFSKLFNRNEEEKSPATQDKELFKVPSGPKKVQSDEKITIKGSENGITDASARLVQGSDQNRGLTGIDHKEFEKVKRELAMKDKRHQEQSDLLQRKLTGMKEALEKSDKERTLAVREREKMKSELEQARLRLAATNAAPEVRASTPVAHSGDEKIVISGKAIGTGASEGAQVIPLRDPAKGGFGAAPAEAFKQPQAPVRQNPQAGFEATPKEETRAAEPVQKKGGFGSKFFKSLNPFSAEAPEVKKSDLKTIESVTEKLSVESTQVSDKGESQSSQSEGIDPRVLAQKERIHERQVDELHRKIKKLEEDNSKLREKTITQDVQVRDQTIRAVKEEKTVQKDLLDTESIEVPSSNAEEKKEIEVRKRKLEEEDQKAIAKAETSEPGVVKPAVLKEIVDPAIREQNLKTAKTLDELKGVAERADSPTVKKVFSEISQSVEPTKSKQWTESLMAEIVSEKARIMELQRTLNMEFKSAEQNYRQRENLLNAELQKREDSLRQKDSLVNRKNELIAQLNMQIEQMKQGNLAVEEAQLKHKLSAAQKLAEMKDFENKNMTEKVRDLENKLMIANAKARNTNESQWKQKIQALEFKLEEAKKQAVRNQDLSAQTKDKASDRELIELKKKFELTERQQQEMRKLLERSAANLKEKTDSERRFQLELQKAQDENKKLKSIISRAGNGGSNAA